MLDVLKCVNDSMHQVAISGFPVRRLGVGLTAGRFAPERCG